MNINFNIFFPHLWICCCSLERVHHLEDSEGAQDLSLEQTHRSSHGMGQEDAGKVKGIGEYQGEGEFFLVALAYCHEMFQ